MNKFIKYTKETIKLKNALGKDINIHIYHLILNDMSKLKKIIEDKIINIWDPNVNYSVEETKQDIYKCISTKSNLQKHGICAEFFMHLFLVELGYNQKCLFSNLEDSSMKKGFDGLYEYSNDFWIAESKSAIVEAKHKDKIYEALVDIDEKISTTNGNNPWKNAIHHIFSRNKSNNNDPLSKRILNLSRDYLREIPHSSSEFNLIPASTLFINNNQQDSEIKKEIENILKNREIKNMIVLCINNDIYNEFYAYLKGK